MGQGMTGSLRPKVLSSVFEPSAISFRSMRIREVHRFLGSRWLAASLADMVGWPCGLQSPNTCTWSISTPSSGADFCKFKEGSSMTYAVIFNPTEEHYNAMRSMGTALKRSSYPLVAQSGLRSREEAERFIEAIGTSPGWSRRSYHIVEES